MKKIKVYVILINYNGFDDTLECIESLEKIKKNINYNVNICVVDNNPNNEDDHAKLIEIKKLYNNLVVLFSKNNNGNFAGNNIGINYAIKNNADYIWVLNNDTTVDKNVIDELLKSAIKINAFFTTKIYNYYDEHELMYSGAIIDKKKLQVDFRRNEISEDVLTEFISGASIFAAVDLWKKYRLPEEYFLYEEDIDFSLMLTSNNIPMYVVAQALIFHKESASTNKLHYIKEYYFIRNKLMLIKKYGKNPWKTIFFVEKFIRFPFRIVRRFLKGILFNKEYIYYTKYECKAYWDFINGRSGIINGNK